MRAQGGGQRGRTGGSRRGSEASQLPPQLHRLHLSILHLARLPALDHRHHQCLDLMTGPHSLVEAEVEAEVEHRADRVTETCHRCSAGVADSMDTSVGVVLLLMQSKQWSQQGRLWQWPHWIAKLHVTWLQVLFPFVGISCIH